MIFVGWVAVFCNPIYSQVLLGWLSPAQPTPTNALRAYTALPHSVLFTFHSPLFCNTVANLIRDTDLLSGNLTIYNNGGNIKMKPLIMLLLLSISSLAIADQTIDIINNQLTPDQTDLYLSNQGVSREQRGINNARYAQLKAEQAESDYNRWREYQNNRVNYERFISPPRR